MLKLVLIMLLAFAAVPAADRPAPVPAAATATADGVAATAPGPQARRRWWIRWLQDFTPGGFPGHGGPGGSPSRPGDGGNPDDSWSLRDELFFSFRRGDCQETLDLAGLDDGAGPPVTETERDLYEGAAAACLAALHGRSDLWPIAESRFEAVRGTRLACRERAVARILREIVLAHRTDPTVSFGRGQGRAVRCLEVAGVRER